VAKSEDWNLPVYTNSLTALHNNFQNSVIGKSQVVLMFPYVLPNEVHDKFLLCNGDKPVPVLQFAVVV
jgi:hypothetical protein